MAVKFYQPSKSISNHHKLLLEKHLLEKHYAFLTVSVSRNLLICQGYCRPTELSTTYDYKIVYKIGNYPKVYCLNPIKYDDEIHMYLDNSLCLFYPKDFSWTNKSFLFNTILPWTHEWFVFYELYQITGKWHHPFVPHNKLLL